MFRLICNSISGRITVQKVIKLPLITVKMSETDIMKVIDFWFGSKTDKDYLQGKSFWYGGSQSDDELVRTNLGDLYQKARNGQLDHWLETSPEGGLALIILLDQVPRNIHRDTPEMYMTDEKALSMAKILMEKGWDKQLSNSTLRRYIYSPLNHSENIEDQEKSVQLAKELGMADHIYWAEHHYNVIKENGRFPHRDQILGRKSE